MSKKKNRFREWLSDNLRYIILGFSMLVILALLYIGFVFLVSLVAGTELKDEQSMQNQQESEVSGDLDEDESTGKNNDENNADKNNADENNADKNNADENSTETDDENDAAEENNSAEN